MLKLKAAGQLSPTMGRCVQVKCFQHRLPAGSMENGNVEWKSHFIFTTEPSSFYRADKHPPLCSQTGMSDKDIDFESYDCIFTMHRFEPCLLFCKET